MGIFDKAKDLAAEHRGAVDGGIDKGADLADQHTGGKYEEKIDQGSEMVKDRADEYLGNADESAPPA